MRIKQVPVGFRQNIVLTGSMKAGKETFQTFSHFIFDFRVTASSFFSMIWMCDTCGVYS